MIGSRIAGVGVGLAMSSGLLTSCFPGAEWEEVTVTAASDAGLVPPDVGSMPPDTGSMPPDVGSMPPDTGPMPPRGPCDNQPFAISTVSQAGAACVGHRMSFGLNVEGGSTRYEWRLVEPETALLDANGAEATVEWALEAGGEQTLTIEVTDACGRVARWSNEVLVHEPPVVVTRELAAVCDGEVVNAVLEASGGDAASYAWHVEGLPEMGLAVQGGSLAGHVQLPEVYQNVTLSVGVSDGFCSSPSVAVSLPIAAASSTQCPRIEVARALDDRLPRPCLGQDYRATFVASGTAETNLWAEVSLPSGWTFDRTTQVLQGTPVGPDRVSVEVTDGAGRTVREEYSFEPREKCWLAYLAAPGTPMRVHLIDPVLQPLFNTRRVLPNSSSEDPALDFAFSPDGRFLAYRIGSAPESARLVLVRLSDFREWPIDSLDAVSSYAWAGDSRVLAVAGTLGGVTQLGGADVSGVAANDPSQLPVEPRMLTPRAVSVDSPLTWFATRFVAFHGAHPAVPFLRQVHFAGLSDGGFEEPVTPGGVIYPSDLQLRPSPGGLFIATPGTGDQDFAPIDGPATRQNDVIVSPAGSLKARVETGELQFFSPEDRTGATPRATVGGCAQLLAWAPNERWIACDVQLEGSHELVMVDVQEALRGAPSTSLVRGLPPPAEYPAGAHVERRRVFSASGSWFAFEMDGAGVVVSVTDGTPRVTEIWDDVTQQPLGNFGQLKFSPDETQLVEHAGSRLIYHHLQDRGREYTRLEEEMLPIGVCSEDFLTAESNWCGDAPRAADFSWSPGSDRVAFVTAAGHLRIKDASLSYGPKWPDALDVDAACGDGCLERGSFMFQP